MSRYRKLREVRKRRLQAKANKRYSRKHPTHKQKHGHKFTRNKAYSDDNPVCKVCGKRWTERGKKNS